MGLFNEFGKILAGGKRKKAKVWKIIIDEVTRPIKMVGLRRKNAPVNS